MMVYSYFDSPLGRILLAADSAGLRLIQFQHQPNPRPPEPQGQSNSQPLQEAMRQLDAYFAGTLRQFRLDLAPEGTPFQHAVWQALQDLPYGTTRSYGALAHSLGKPQAWRAVGAANGRNPLAIVIPCHRVIGSTGKLTGYRGGLEIKEALLRFERQPASPGSKQTTLPFRS